MNGPIRQYLAEDHSRLDALLARATEQPGPVDRESFEQFRRGLLRHIGLEEKIILPAARRVLGHQVPGFDRLRADHSRLVALLVPSPTRAIAEELQSILAPHNEVEEAPGGIYELCEDLLGEEAQEVASRLRQAPEVPVRPHYDGRVPKMIGG